MPVRHRHRRPQRNATHRNATQRTVHPVLLDKMQKVYELFAYHVEEKDHAVLVARVLHVVEPAEPRDRTREGERTGGRRARALATRIVSSNARSLPSSHRRVSDGNAAVVKSASLDPCVACASGELVTCSVQQPSGTTRPRWIRSTDLKKLDWT